MINRHQNSPFGLVKILFSTYISGLFKKNKKHPTGAINKKTHPHRMCRQMINMQQPISQRKDNPTNISFSSESPPFAEFVNGLR